MRFVESRDGTRIAFESSGAGPPHVLVHGTGIDHTYWAPVLPELERHFKVHAVDRRGRGQSGDSDTYTMKREFEDVACLVDSLSEPVFLLGHSYGALCSLETALLTTNIRKLLLYEPPMYTKFDFSYPSDVEERYHDYLQAGEPEKALLMLYRIGETPDEELRLLRPRRTGRCAWRLRTPSPGR